MKALVLGLDGLPGGRLLGVDRLAHVRLLMESGCFGPLSGDLPHEADAFWRALECGRAVGQGEESPTLPGLLAEDGPPAILVEPARSADPIESSRSAFDDLLRRSASGPWSYARLIDDAPARLRSAEGEAEWEAALDAWLSRFDAGLPALLECLGDEAIVLVVARDDTSAAFVVATSTGVAPGEVSDIRLDDLAPMLLALAGRPIPPSMTGRPPDALPSAGAGDEDDGEQAVLDRLKGLGYL